jgi:FkbM family methyltransferase
MTFISYAQNYEDVMLYRALKRVEKGFYIDVGAMDPVVDSVTKAFYQRGWRGINIEPVHQWYEKLVLDRPEDTNLNVAVLDRPGVVRLYDIVDTGLSTIDRTLAERHKEDGGYQTRDITVTAVTLDMVLEEHPHEEVHFLKVDVEGAERQVLEGIDLTRTRPWIILVEATKPLTQEQDYVNWEQLITDREYVFAYFDGLNRFYVARERPELLLAFNTPPNFFDCFVRASEHNAQAALSNVQAALSNVQVALSNVQAALDSVYASRSWRMTLPLRKTAGLVRWSARLPARITRGTAKRAKAVIKRILVRMIAEVVRHPSLKAKAVSLVNRYPNLKNRLKALAVGSGIGQSVPSAVYDPTLTIAGGPQNLSLRARQIYLDLLDAIEQNKAGR